MVAELPTEMRYVAHGSGGPELMRIATGPLPTLRDGDVLIRVAAVGVNRPDVAQRQGHYPPPPGASPVLGLEVAGEVVAASGITRFVPGDLVCGLANGGAYAEFCAIPATQCLPWPAGYDAVHAAALPENFFTVWANLFGHGRLQPGDRALIHGGTSGIGVTAIQLARAFGAVPYATAGSEAKCAACRRLGAEDAVNYREQDFAAAVKAWTDGKGVDVVLDMVGAPYASRNLRALAMDGRLVIIAFLGGAKAESLDLMPIMVRRLTVTGSTMRPRTAAQKGAIARELEQKVWPILSAGRCRPVIHEVFPMERVAEAHSVMESSAHIGKIMLRWAPETISIGD